MLKLTVGILVAFLACASHGDSAIFSRADLLLVRARLRDCPDRLRLLEVVRVGTGKVAILDLAHFTVIGRAPADVLRDVRARYRERVPGAPLPPITIELERDRDAFWEVAWLQESIEELACGGHFVPESLRRPDRRPNALFERIAAR